MTTSPASIQFKWIVQALAQPAEVQLGLYPRFVAAADELALEHEEMQGAFLTDAGTTLNLGQRAAIQALDKQLADMSGKDQAPLWTDDALQAKSEWEYVRSLARSVLNAMGWDDTPPPTNRGALYVH